MHPRSRSSVIARTFALLLSSCAPFVTSCAPTAPPLTIAQALAQSPGNEVTILAYLCWDFSKKQCPIHPNVGPCPTPDWLYCDRPAETPNSLMIWVDIVPGMALEQGQRYVLKGRLVAANHLHLETARLVETRAE
jgi:hypothetical protein